MNEFDNELSGRLDDIRKQDLYRVLRRIDSPQAPHIETEGRTVLNFSSNDYLGLANDPSLKAAAVEAIRHWGSGSGASRLVCGSLSPHHELEETIASFKGTEAALSFSSGYAAALGTICSLLNKNDVVILDKLIHASIIDAARLSGATIRVFAHNDLNDLEDSLKWATKRGVRIPESPVSNQRGHILIVTESVFSMDGDRAPLKEMVTLKDQYGAWLMVDEAHATGLYGKNRRGLAEESDVSERIDIQMGTLGKALGSSGGYICGSRILIDFLINRARSFVFSTAPVPAAAAAATAGIRFVQSEAGETRRQALWATVSQLTQMLGNPAPKVPSQILPFLLGAETKALEAARILREKGIFIPAIRYPSVARGEARLRVTLTAAHTGKDIRIVADALAEISDTLKVGKITACNETAQSAST